MLDYARAAISDLRSGLEKWRVWSILAVNDIRRRYRRSTIGQFWLTLSMGVTIVSIGVLYSQILHTEINSYLTYISVTFVFWGFISSSLTESCTAYSEGEPLLRHMYMPRSLLVCRTIARNLIVVGHNAIIIPCVFLFFLVVPTAKMAWLLVGLPLLLLNLCWIGLILSIICARFRDVPQIVASAMQLMFFVTPVIYRPDIFKGSAAWMIYLNPFASLLEIVRDPLLSRAPSTLALCICVGMALAGFSVTLPFFGRYSPRVIYWL